MSMKRWILPKLDKDAAAALAGDCNIPPFLAVLLTARGITDPAVAEEFLSCTELSDDPFAFADMDLAVARIQQAIDTGERILIFGDYDADGITATVLLYLYLQSQNSLVEYYIPRREEGYGLSREVLSQKASEGISLIVTVDNGIAAIEEVALAAELGIDVVITDHHQPQATLPAAVAVVNPHRADCGSRLKDYAGVGVAFKLVCALDGDEQQMLDTFGDLVALGTLADVMPLVDENRVLVKRGLEQISRAPRIGIKALLDAAGMGEKSLSSSAMVFTVSPRINAAGRMGNPVAAAQLLLAQTEEEAAAIAAEIQSYNVERQTVEASILQEVSTQIERHPEWMCQRILVIEGHDWYHGVIGIIAARVLDKYGKPCIVLSADGDHAKGSGRSVAGVSLFDAVSSCGDILTSFGGHELAVGVSLHPDKIDEFRRRINEYAAQMYPTMPIPELRLDCKLVPSQIDLEKLNLMALLEPFGAGNPSPLFGLFNMTVDNITAVGNGRHLRLTLSRDNVRVSAMRFNCTPQAFPFSCGDVVNAVISLDRNEFRGVVSPSVIVRDIRYADTDQDALIDSMQIFDGILRQDLPQDRIPLPPTRDQLGALYRSLKKVTRFEGTTEKLARPVLASGMTYASARAGVEILRQAGLLTVEDNGNTLCITVLPSAEKVDLTATDTMRYLTQ